MQRASLWFAILAFFLTASALAAMAAPYAAGNRYFPPTPLVEDPFVADEAGLRSSYLRHGAKGDDPANHTIDMTYEFARRVTDRFGVSLEHGYSIVEPHGAPNAYGFSNPELTLKYQLYENALHEFLFSIGVTREFGGVGARRVDAEAVGNTAPTLYVAKGFGDLPPSLRYLAPIGVTGLVAYQIFDQRAHTTITRDAQTGSSSLDRDFFPDTLQLGLSVQYSLRYLEGNVDYLGLPSWLSRLTPFVEFHAAAPVSRSYGTATTATVAPGLVYSGDHFYLAAEALVPTTRRTGEGVGGMASLKLRLDMALPALFGAPLFGEGDRP